MFETMDSLKVGYLVIRVLLNNFAQMLCRTVQEQTEFYFALCVQTPTTVPPPPDPSLVSSVADPVITMACPAPGMTSTEAVHWTATRLCSCF